MKHLRKFNEDIQEELDDFEDTYGFPMGEDFVFAINTDEYYWRIAISPLSYWNEEGYQYDQEIDYIIKEIYPALNDVVYELSEESECTFNLYFNGDVVSDVETMVVFLADAGLKFSKSFQESICENKVLNDEVEKLVIKNGYPVIK